MKDDFVSDDEEEGEDGENMDESEESDEEFHDTLKRSKS